MNLTNIIKKINQLIKRNTSKRSFKEDSLIQQGREQFTSLIKKGLGVPVVLL